MNVEFNNIKKADLDYAISNFHHEVGVHCTSTAIRDIFEYHGLKLSEAMVFGLGSGLGLSYIKLGGKYPVIGGRQYKFEEKLCSLLNIQCNIFRTKDKEKGWLQLRRYLENNRPTAINIDMAFLDYRNLPENFHFGMHTVVVAGYNPKRETVLIADTQYPDLKEITLETLHNSRNYKYDRIMDSNNFIYEFEFPYIIPPLKDLIPFAIRKTGENVQKKCRLMRLFGVINGFDSINRFSKDLEAFNTLSNQDLVECCIEISGYIGVRDSHNFGTGGGLFRYLYSGFLEEAAKILEDKELSKLSNFYDKLGKEWEKIAMTIMDLPKIKSKEISEKINDMRNSLIKIKDLEQQGALRLKNYSG